MRTPCTLPLGPPLFPNAELWIIEFDYLEAHKLLVQDNMRLDTVYSTAWLTRPVKVVHPSNVRTAYGPPSPLLCASWSSSAFGVSLPMSNSILASTQCKLISLRYNYFSTSLWTGMSSTVTGSLTLKKTFHSSTALGPCRSQTYSK